MQNRAGTGAVAGHDIDCGMRCQNVMQPDEAHVAVRIEQLAACDGRQMMGADGHIQDECEQTA